MAAQSSQMAPQAVPVGSRVVVLVSKGVPESAAPSYVTVPSVLGKSQGDALGDLQAAGLSARVFDDPSPSVARGRVAAQTPMAGQTAMSSAEVVLLVSSGPPAQGAQQVALPSVIGAAESDAVAKLRSAGLEPEVVHDYSAAVPSGVVVDQIPNPAVAPPPQKRSLAWLWVLLAVLLVAGVGIAAFLWLNRSAEVPSVVGLSQANAQSAITGAGFRVGSVTTTQTVSAAAVGKVVSQSPSGGEQARLRSAIDIVVSGGQALIEVPDVKGKTKKEAEDALKKVGLKWTTTSGNSNSVDKGKVMSQAPDAGQQVPAGTSIGLTISQGPKAAAVPNVVGETEADAKSALEDAGLAEKVVSNYNSSVPKGQVYSQTPSNGTLVAPGTSVSIHVSKGAPPAPETVTVPNVIGDTQSQATSTLQGLGFKVSVSQIASGTAGEVVGQAPQADAKEPKRSTVSIVVSVGGSQ
ncbi:MAG: PASTA domain-containing protein [Coriobacteriales bacterium]|nr:PASTA domain-containing protein [Coriobacteriales bacterium]